MCIIKLLKQFNINKFESFSILRILPVLAAVSSSVAFAEFIDHPVFGENTWVDSTGLSWSSPVQDTDGAILKVTLPEAEDICKARFSRLPNSQEVERIMNADPLLPPVEYHNWMREKGWNNQSFHPSRYMNSDVHAVQCVMSREKTEEMKDLSEVVAKIERECADIDQPQAVEEPQIQQNFDDAKNNEGAKRQTKSWELSNGSKIVGSGLLSGYFSYIASKAGECANILSNSNGPRFFYSLRNRFSFNWHEKILMHPFMKDSAGEFANFGPTAKCFAVVAGAYCTYKACSVLLGNNESSSGKTQSASTVAADKAPELKDLKSITLYEGEESKRFSKIGSGKSHLIIDPAGKVKPFILSDVGPWEFDFFAEEYCEKNNGKLTSKEQLEALSRAMSPDGKFDPSLLTGNYEGWSGWFRYSELWSPDWVDESSKYVFNGANGKVEPMRTRRYDRFPYMNVQKSVRCAHSL